MSKSRTTKRQPKLTLRKLLIRSNDKKFLNARWWSQTGSNRRPPACKAGALPAELWPQEHHGSVLSNHMLDSFEFPTIGCMLPLWPDRLSNHEEMVGLGRLELPTSRLSSARSNQLSYRPDSLPRIPHKTLVTLLRVHHYYERDTKTALRRRAPTSLNR